MPATRCRPERTKGAQGRVTEKRKRGHTDVAPSKKKKCLFPNSGSYKAAATLPEGVARDSAGALKFDDFPEFRPNLTPREVLVRGAFGGCYFNPKGGKQGVKFPYKTTSGVPITHLTVLHPPPPSGQEFPKEWFEGLEDEKFLSRKYRCEVNKYGVKAGQDQRYWEVSWVHSSSVQSHKCSDSTVVWNVTRSHRADHTNTGRRKDGYTSKTREAGSTGIVASSSVGVQRTMFAKSQDGSVSPAKRDDGSGTC
eukprot:scaffold3734_cov425-Prasinococcus_capsulatus_cf.AAC.13